MRALLVGGMLLASVCAWAAPRALILSDAANPALGAVERALQPALERAGYQVETGSSGVLADAGGAPQAELVVLTRADRLPAAAGPAIDAFLKRGGKLIALRTPAWQTPLVRAGERWMTDQEYQRRAAGTMPDHLLTSFGPDDVAQWTRSTNNAASPVRVESGPAFGSGTRSLSVEIADLTGWDTFNSPILENPFPPGQTVTSFAARGDRHTNQLEVEWAEKDGSRWIAVVSLTPEWRHYALPPEAFRYWQSNPTRGFAGDRLRPENAARMNFGLAFTHTTAVGSGQHHFWVANVGTSTPRAGDQADPGRVEMPPVDGLWPKYKLYRAAGPLALRAAPSGTAYGTGEALPAAQQVWCVQPRPAGAGFDKRRQWRWLSLATAWAPDGDRRGDPAALVAWAGGPYKGAMLASFGVQDEGFYSRPQVARLVSAAARFMARGVFFREAGSTAFTYFADETPTFGAAVANFGPPAECTVRVQLRPVEKGKLLRELVWKQRVGTGEEFAPRAAVKGLRWPPQGLSCECTLTVGSRVVDAMAQQVHVWRPPSKPHFVRTANGEFTLDGKPWRAHGVNYMPSSGIGAEDGHYFEQWIDREAYDPEIVDRDLRRIQGMGLNAVSAFIYGGAVPAHNLLDFLRLCEKYGIKVNLSLRPGTPMDFEWGAVSSIIRTFRLKQNDTVFAYDLAWEPSFGNHAARKRWDPDWKRWIEDRYGSVEAAEADWGAPAPREEGQLTNPTDAQLTNDGAWRAMVAAYRHFLDDLLYRKYHAAAALLRTVDPNHLISFRMSEGGNPTYNWDAFLPYDFPGLGSAVDFLSPEAYGRIGDWEKVKPGVFEVAYARACAPEKPVIWAEMGMSVMNAAIYEDDPALMQRQADFNRAFFRLLKMSHANGILYWWYPGGFRWGENSDFGIINPDGTDRPVTRVIRQEARGFLNVGPAPKPDTWLTIDRDADARGPYAIYERTKDAFWRAIGAGRHPGLRWVDPKLDSRTVPLIAIGNRPFTGHNPPKLLDAAIDQVALQSDRGALLALLSDGQTVGVPGGRPMQIMVRLRNTGPTAWRHLPSVLPATGEVRLWVTGVAVHWELGESARPRAASSFIVGFAAPNEGQTAEVTLQPGVQGRAAFGDVFRFRLRGE